MQSNDQPNRLEINEKVVRVFQPEVDKLADFMDFTVIFFLILMEKMDFLE